MSKKPEQKDIVYGITYGKHEDMKDVLQGWDNRIAETKKHNLEVNKKRKGQVKLVHKTYKAKPLPSEIDPNYVYGMSTHDIDQKTDPFLRSNAIIERRNEQHEREMKKLENSQKDAKKHPRKKIDPLRPTAASLGHTKKKETEPPLKETFKMKRFTKFEHGKIDTGLRKKKPAEEKPK
ncbi:hypothetical protein GPJ56_010610 [Histomonas meleagridis]|uniref:uncharacterized protein n=1 Tax=Histomonas meleagridis TaxID=135588 RepID=UPI00355A3122|nr:hypothetical protein GPJ56_010610 [Histomonas meleagridis]KAH0804005.1 hypothetical protein GO595_002835 [Histomonas meleagridis]